MDDSQKDLETGFKVISIMQTVIEEFDEKSRRMLRKLLCMEHPKKDRLLTPEIETSEEINPQQKTQ